MTVTSRTDGVVGHPDRHDADGGAPTWWRDDAPPARYDDPSPAPCEPPASGVFDYEVMSPELGVADVVAHRSRRAVVTSIPIRPAGGLPAVPAASPSSSAPPPAGVTEPVPIAPPVAAPTAAAPSPVPTGLPVPTAPPAPAGRRVGSSHLPLHLRQRRARLSVFVVLAVTAGLTVLALLTARSPAVPTTSLVPSSPPVSVTIAGHVGVVTAGLAPSVEPPPAPGGSAPAGPPGAAAP
jgi:hypothetical protein